MNICKEFDENIVINNFLENRVKILWKDMYLMIV